MSPKRVLTILTFVGALIAAGCGGQQPAPPPVAAPKAPVVEGPKAPVITQEQIAAVAKADLDPKSLPPPRPALAATPDLSNAVYAINSATLAAMGKDGVPADVVESLRKLDGKTFGSTPDFLAAARDAAGAGPLTANQDSILRNALVVTLAEPPVGPKGQASLDEAFARSQVAPLSTTPVVVVTSTEFKLVYFDFDKYNIKPEFVAIIKGNAQKLVAEKMKVVIEGHCDERGTNEYNLALGQRRAEAVRQALVTEGVPADQLKTVSYGEERPVDLGHTEEAWAKNRRAVLTPQ